MADKETKAKTVTVVVADAKSLALPRIVDGVSFVAFKDGKAEVPEAIAAELKQHYPNLVTVL